MPTERSSRWITIREPFNYPWSSGAVTYYSEPGGFLVKDEVADFAVEKGYATEGKVDGSSKSRKGGVKRIRARRQKKEAAAAKAANARPDARVAAAPVAPADSAGAGDGVDPASG